MLAHILYNNITRFKCGGVGVSGFLYGINFYRMIITITLLPSACAILLSFVARQTASLVVNPRAQQLVKHKRNYHA